MSQRNAKAYCSFCRKSYKEVSPLVEGPDNVYICRECVELSRAIIGQEIRRRARRNGETSSQRYDAARGRFEALSALPSDAGETLLQAAHDHDAAENDVAPNLIVLAGPSPGSRQYVAGSLAHALDVPFVLGDAALLSGPGAAELLFDQLLRAGDYDVELATRGIVYVDEFDQPATQEWTSRLWQETVCDRFDRPVQINFGRLLYVGGGTFAGMGAETGVTRGLIPKALMADAEVLGLAPALADHLAAVVRVPRLEEATLGRLVMCADFDRMLPGGAV